MCVEYSVIVLSYSDKLCAIQCIVCVYDVILYLLFLLLQCIVVVYIETQ